MKLEQTQRGFIRANFTDRNGVACSIQKSSIGTEDCIWLGCEHEVFDQNRLACGARMHLTQERAAQLIPLLQHFVETGELPCE